MNSVLFTIKTVLRRMIDLFPINAIPEINPTTKEGIVFNTTIRQIIHDSELNGIEPENFLVFCESFRKMVLFLMEKDGYYRRYVTMFFDIIQKEWKNP